MDAQSKVIGNANQYFEILPQNSTCAVLYSKMPISETSLAKRSMYSPATRSVTVPFEILVAKVLGLVIDLKSHQSPVLRQHGGWMQADAWSRTL